jgi:beta-glucosidase
MTEPILRHFPDKFVWGAATSAYQIEGAWNEDGRGLSIWDTFSHTPGRIERNENGKIACDHYHRLESDVALMSELGLKAYRFSTAWPRIFPQGDGALNPAGLDFYDRLVDALLERGIRPFVTLYHWDLPQALQDRGGWVSPDTVHAFEKYATILARRLGDRVQDWITHNEPMVASLVGHYFGIHAPGEQNPLTALQVAANLLKSHGLAVQTLRAELSSVAKIGIILNLTPAYPERESELDQAAARRFDLFSSRLFLDPLLRGTLPEELGSLFIGLPELLSPDDLTVVSQSLDFLGINYYSRAVLKHDPQVPLLQAVDVLPEGNEYSQMWEIYPAGIYAVLDRVWREYVQPYQPHLRLFITENGICVPDGVDFDGRVRDERRIRYLFSHLEQAWFAIQQGIPLDGYFTWSLLDNFEWAYGYRPRFGLVYVDFETQHRIIKDSGRWFSRVIHQNGIS